MVEQWLETIQHRAGAGARVHVVATHGGPPSRASALDETRLRERFGSMIAGFHNVDSKDPDTLVGLTAAIADTAAAVPHCRRWYPNSWITAREKLADIGQQSLSYQDYMAHSGLSESAARSLAINSHALGHWIHYADEPALAEVVILKPDWLSVAIAAVLDDQEAGKSDGLVPHRLFGRIWSAPTRPYTHLQQQLFLRVMERYELTYRVPELDAGEPVSLVGQLVPAARPDLHTVWDGFRADGPEAVEICQIVEKATDRSASPPGLIYRLIVRLHRQALDRAEAPDGAHWRGGLVVHSRYGARALITLTSDGVRVHVRGPDPCTYLHQLADEVRDCVDGFWTGLTTRAMIPCQGLCGPDNQRRGLFDRDKLINARDRGVDVAQCPVSGCEQWPSIDGLLGAPSRPAPTTKDIAARLDRLETRLLTRIDTLDDDQKALLHRVDAGLTRIMRTLADEAADCPRLFTLVPLDRSMLHPGWTTTRMRLTLYCEHSRVPVHVLDPDRPNAGIYTVEVPRDWWIKAVPLLKLTAALVKLILGVGLATAELDLSTEQWDTIHERLTVSKEALADAAEFVASEARGVSLDDLNHPDAVDRIVRAEGGMLRTLRAMLDKQDRTFADLRRVTDHRGGYLWVHPLFVHIYQPPLPEIPR